MRNQLIDRKPAYPSFSQSKIISSLQDEYQSKEMKEAFTILEQKYNHYRKVRGDGNCFIRAVAFSYITTKKLKFMKDVFKNIENIDMVSMYKESIPKAFYEIYNKQTMIEILSKYWNEKMKVSENTIQSISARLATMLSDHVVLDFIMIAYFRSICFQQYQKNKTQYEPYGIGNQLQIINTYGIQSEGLIIRILSDALKTNITINQIDKKHGFTEIKYDYQNTTDNVHLLLKPGHYDVLQSPKNVSSQTFGYKVDKYDKNMRSTFIVISKNKNKSYQYQQQSSSQPKTQKIIFINDMPRGKTKNTQTFQILSSSNQVNKLNVINPNKQISSNKLDCIDCIQLRKSQYFREDLCFECHIIKQNLSVIHQNQQTQINNEQKYPNKNQTINILPTPIQESDQIPNKVIKMSGSSPNIRENNEQKEEGNKIKIKQKTKTKTRNIITFPMFEQQQLINNELLDQQSKCLKCNRNIKQKTNIQSLCQSCIGKQSMPKNKIDERH